MPRIVAFAGAGVLASGGRWRTAAAARTDERTHPHEVRLTLALLFVIPAAMAYPWQSTADRWLLGVAVAALIILFAWWRGLFSRRSRSPARAAGPQPQAEARPGRPTYTTVLLRVEHPREPESAAGAGRRLPGSLRHPLRQGARHEPGYGGTRTTWIGLTLGAADNLAALQGAVAANPVAGHRRLSPGGWRTISARSGWSVTIVDTAGLCHTDPQAKETWRGVPDGPGYLAAYRIAVDDQLTEPSLRCWVTARQEIWTRWNSPATATDPDVAAACAFRTASGRARRARWPGLTPERGLHASGPRPRWIRFRSSASTLDQSRAGFPRAC